MFSFIYKVLIIAVTIAFLGSWGIIKQQRKEQELIDKLYNKASKKIIKALKSNDSLSDKQIEVILKNIKASLFWSKSQIKVTNVNTLKKELLKKMIDKDMISTRINKGKVVYCLNKN
ncbi:hypothetical protein PV797_21400 [Clostridiaceae bacterium M8S5]|nr:hypothetical protein PV797_21400 [Clostridiaceae bacterium M8S5]